MGGGLEVAKERKHTRGPLGGKIDIKNGMSLTGRM